MFSAETNVRPHCNLQVRCWDKSNWKICASEVGRVRSGMSLHLGGICALPWKEFHGTPFLSTFLLAHTGTIPMQYKRAGLYLSAVSLCNTWHYTEVRPREQLVID